MKKINQNLKVLTSKEADKVKGGGWLYNGLNPSNGKYSLWGRLLGTNGEPCPPPEPDNEYNVTRK